MPNTYFRFKQFTVHQEHTAMKVCTDSCILGAWTAKRIENAQTILDIGAGTGLLSLMLAQTSASTIRAIEIEPSAYIQANNNIANSPWANRIQILSGDVKTYCFDAGFDWIITNPPFYQSDLKSDLPGKNLAKHGESLTLEDLILAISKNLNPDGYFSILLPAHRDDYFETIAKEAGFYFHEKLYIRQTPGHSPFRVVGLLSRRFVKNPEIKELNIKNAQGKNTAEFTEMMEDYYL